MVTVQLPEDIDNRLNIIAQKTGCSKTDFMIQALEEWLGDYEDSLIALSRLEQGGKRIPFEELEKELGLDR